MDPLPRVTSKTAIFDEALQLCQTFPSDAAGDVVGLGGRSEARRLRRFLEGHGAPHLGQALNLLGEFEIHVAVEHDVDVIAQPSGADIFIAKIGVRHLALIERVAQPADRIRVSPRHPHADARRFGRVPRHVRRGGGAGEVEAQIVGGGANRVGQTLLGGKDPRSGREVRSARAECALGDFDAEASQPVTRRQQFLLAGVFHQEDGAGARHFARRMRFFSQRSESWPSAPTASAVGIACR